MTSRGRLGHASRDRLTVRASLSGIAERAYAFSRLLLLHSHMFGDRVHQLAGAVQQESLIMVSWSLYLQPGWEGRVVILTRAGS